MPVVPPPRGTLIVGCTVAGCRWRHTVRLWAVGITAAAEECRTSLDDHLATEHEQE